MATTRNLLAFKIMSFLQGIFTVTPQLLVPLSAEISPPEQRGLAVSIVYSGLMLGILMARVLSGIVAQFTDWRNVYWVAVGIQGLVLCSMWYIMKDSPAKVRDPRGDAGPMETHIFDLFLFSRTWD